MLRTVHLWAYGMIRAGPPPAGPGRASGWSGRPGPSRCARPRHGTRGVARPPAGRRPGCWRRAAIQLRAGSRRRGHGGRHDDLAGRARASPEPAGLPGSNNRMLAVAATSALSATPDPRVTEFMPRPLLEPAQTRASTVRSRRPARRQQLFRDFLPLRRSGRGWLWMGMIRRVSQETGPSRPAGRRHETAWGGHARPRAGAGLFRLPANSAATAPRRRPGRGEPEQIPQWGSPHPPGRYSLIPPRGSADTPGGFNPQRGPLRRVHRYSSSGGS